MKGYTCVAKVPIYSAGRHFDCEFKQITSSNDATQYSTQRIPKTYIKNQRENDYNKEISCLFSVHTCFIVYSIIITKKY